MEDKKDRVAVITGAGDEIGEMISLNLAKAGAKIVICDVDRNKGKCDSIVSGIEKGGGEAISLACDLTKADDAATVVKNAMGRFGKIDILINNVDDSFGKPIDKISDDDWGRSMNNNLKSIFLFCREAVPKMREQKYGRIINLGSLYYLGWPGNVNYSAAKAGILGLTRALALELAKDGITVNQILKGDITGTQEGMTEEEEARLAKGIPVQRLGKPEDVAYAVSYLATDEAKYVTGQTLFVCGGKSIHFSLSV